MFKWSQQIGILVVQVALAASAWSQMARYGIVVHRLQSRLSPVKLHPFVAS
jgi:hypothetical protein